MQIYDKGKARIKKYIEDEKPEFVSLALDGWSIHHHGYMYYNDNPYVMNKM